jgi:hypothetical protein
LPKIHAQSELEKIQRNTIYEINGKVIDSLSQTPLPYISVITLNKNKGTVTNEKGNYQLDLHNLSNNDSISFQSIGYITITRSIADLKNTPNIKLTENVFDLKEVYILNNNESPKSIVKKVLEKKDENYSLTNSKNNLFMRLRYIGDVENFKIDYKKSNISFFDRNKILEIEKQLPKQNIYYTDFLGTAYSSYDKKKNLSLKLNPIRTVSLKQKEFEIFKSLDSLFQTTEKKEYWKIKSGIIGKKLQIQKSSKNDSTKKNTESVNRMNHTLKNQLAFSTFNNKDSWEFLHSTQKYNYEFVGGTTLEDEEIYIIDFTPKKKGLFEGRLYISMKTYALLKADFEFSDTKSDKNFNMFGINKSRINFEGFIVFEKSTEGYVLKYFSKKVTEINGIDRKMNLLKKRDRFLFDKTLNKLSINLKASFTHQYSVEYMATNYSTIAKKTFIDFKQKARHKVIYVDSFDESLWKGYETIVPLENMKAYKSIE